MAPISNPPTPARTSRPSRGSGLFTLRASSTIWAFRCRASRSIPVPLPVIKKAGKPVKAARMAVLGVVLPIPISPVASSSTPFSISAAATSIPASTAARACSLLMAGPVAISPVPGPTRRTFRRGSSTGLTIPTSTQITLAPACLVRTLIAAPPSRNPRTICRVTSWSATLTFRAATPWSPAQVMTALFSRTGFTSPVIPAIFTATSSSMPRLP